MSDDTAGVSEPPIDRADFPLPARWLMDGSVHSRDFSECHCHGGKCEECGAVLHTQAGYGFYIRLCAECGGER